MRITHAPERNKAIPIVAGWLADWLMLHITTHLCISYCARDCLTLMSGLFRCTNIRHSSVWTSIAIPFFSTCWPHKFRILRVISAATNGSKFKLKMQKKNSSGILVVCVRALNTYVNKVSNFCFLFFHLFILSSIRRIICHIGAIQCRRNWCCAESMSHIFL